MLTPPPPSLRVVVLPVTPFRRRRSEPPSFLSEQRIVLFLPPLRTVFDLFFDELWRTCILPFLLFGRPTFPLFVSFFFISGLLLQHTRPPPSIREIPLNFPLLLYVSTFYSPYPAHRFAWSFFHLGRACRFIPPPPPPLPLFFHNQNSLRSFAVNALFFSPHGGSENLPFFFSFFLSTNCLGFHAFPWR